ncbi:MAG: sulfite exporter TauE/SafE family protein [Burkholderiales bacterium]
MTVTDLLQPEILILAPLIVFAAYVVFGISGFGSTLIAVPLLAHLFPLKFVVPFFVIIDCVGAFNMGLRLRADVMRREIFLLLPFMALGILCGVWLLVRVHAELLIGGLGLFVTFFGLSYILKRGKGFPLPHWSGAPLGMFGGATSAVFGIGGPIYVFFLTGRGATPTQIRATVPMIFMFTTLARIALFIAAGLYSPASLVAAGALLPVMALGVWTGHHLHLNMSQQTVVRVMGALLVVNGISLLIRAATT